MGMEAHEDLVQPLLYPLFAVWPKERSLTSLNLCFLIWKMGVMLPPFWVRLRAKCVKHFTHRMCSVNDHFSFSQCRDLLRKKFSKDLFNVCPVPIPELGLKAGLVQW